MMILNFFASLSEMAGLPPIVLVGALVILLFLIIFGLLILIRVKNITKALITVNSSLDSIVHKIGKQSVDPEMETAYGYKKESAANSANKSADSDPPRHTSQNSAATSFPKKESKTVLEAKAADSPGRIETKSPIDVARGVTSEEHAINQEISARIYDLLKKSGKPIPYHNLTKHLAKDYPGYNYDYFLKEVEGLQEDQKIEVQLVAGKLYFQIRKP